MDIDIINAHVRKEERINTLTALRKALEESDYSDRSGEEVRLLLIAALRLGIALTGKKPLEKFV